jgi:hypothetical protein
MSEEEVNNENRTIENGQQTTENTAVSEQSTINDQPSTQMEVHHHPNVEKKNFKEYLLEGLMIFIAVTLGFFAETIREHITEHNRAKEYAGYMISDLKTDTTQLDSYISYMSYAVNNVDTLISLLSKSDPKDVSSGKLYWYGLWGGAHHYFITNDATFQQMKNSGSLRYLTNDTLIQHIADYDRLCRDMQASDEMEHDIYTEVRKSRSHLFDFKYNAIANDIYLANKISFSQQRIDSFINTNPPLLSTDKAMFNEYIELVRSRYLNLNVTHADELLKAASKLNEDLKNEYNL